MSIFRRRRDRLAGRVARLIREEQAARTAEDEARLAQIHDEAWRLEKELIPLVPEHDLLVLGGLIELARLCLPYQIASGNWLGAIASGEALCAASNAAIEFGVMGRGYSTPTRAFAELVRRWYGIPEAVAYSAHLANDPLAAVSVIETLTNAVVGKRTEAAMISRFREKEISGSADYPEVEEYRRQMLKIAPVSLPTSAGPDAIRMQNESLLAAEMSLLPSDFFELFFVASPQAHALRAARTTSRTLVYLTAGPGELGGVAIRIDPHAGPGGIATSTYLPELPTQVVESWLDEMAGVFRRSIAQEIGERELGRRILSMLDRVGATIWGQLLHSWPDLLSRPVALCPIGRVALLPLFTAFIDGMPICTRADLTITPSARALHLAAARPANGLAGKVFVAADPWHGDDYLSQVEAEARSIAAIHGCQPLLYNITETTVSNKVHMRAFSGSVSVPKTGTDRELGRRLREASIAHLACHGSLADFIGPLLLLGEVMSLTDLIGGEFDMLPTRPLVVLSACQLGGFVTGDIPAEHFGFPAGLMAMGARAVVGSLWPLPDSKATISLMEAFHRRLSNVEPSTALADAVSSAYARGISPAVWGSLIHFGI